MTTLIDMIRHGTPEGGHQYRGHNIDDPLSEKGWAQMWSAVEKYPPWELVVSSPMQRCLSFAQAYAQNHGLAVEIDENFKEIGFGEWEGKTMKELLDKDPDIIRNFYHDPVKYKPQGAEDISHFQKRVHSAIQSLLDKHQGKAILVVAHAGVIRATITSIMQVEPAAMYRTSIDNATIIRIKDDGIRPPTLML